MTLKQCLQVCNTVILVLVCSRASTSIQVLLLHQAESVGWNHVIADNTAAAVGLVEILPLVEFFIEEGIDDKEAVSLLELEPVKKDKDRFKETTSTS